MLTFVTSGSVLTVLVVIADSVDMIAYVAGIGTSAKEFESWVSTASVESTRTCCAVDEVCSSWVDAKSVSSPVVLNADVSDARSGAASAVISRLLDVVSLLGSSEAEIVPSWKVSSCGGTCWQLASCLLHYRSAEKAVP